MSQLYKTQLEKDLMLSEVSDRTRVTLVCERHHYIAEGPPAETACADCWMVYYMKLYAQTPPSKRSESFGEWEKGIRDACQMEDEGTFDFVVFDRPIIKMEKE